MSEQRPPYTINPHFSEWGLDAELSDDMTRFPPHVHKWELGFSYFGGIENEKQVAFCDGCGAVMSQEEVEAVLNKHAQETL